MSKGCITAIAVPMILCGLALFPILIILFIVTAPVWASVLLCLEAMKTADPRKGSKFG